MQNPKMEGKGWVKQSGNFLEKTNRGNKADSKKFDTGPISVSKKLISSEIFKKVFSNLKI